MYDVSDIMPLLEQIVDSKPDSYTYTQKLNPRTGATSCMYVFNGDPDCIVGHLLKMLPDPDRDGTLLDRLDIDNTSDNTQTIAHLWDRRDLVGVFTEPAVRLMQSLQGLQDRGVSWREALMAAKTSVAAPSR